MATVYPVTLADAKLWARVLADDEDAIFNDLIAVASISVQEMAGVVITYEDGDDTVDAPLNLRQAVLLLVAYWFKTREAATEKERREVPFGVKCLVDLSRVGWAGA